MEFRQVQGFIRVNVAQSRHEFLVEEEWFKLPLAQLEGGIQPSGSKSLRKRFRSKVTESFRGIFHQPDATELARVIEDEAGIL